MPNLDKLSVAELEQALAEKRDHLAGLTARREALQKELASVETELKTLGGAAPKRRGRPAGSAAAKPAKKGPKTGPRPKNKLKMKEAIATVLKGAKDGLSLKETAAGVKKLGYKSNSDKFENVVYQNLYGSKALFPKNRAGKYTVTAEGVEKFLGKSGKK